MGACGSCLVCTCVWDEFSEFLPENRVPTSADFNTYPIQIFIINVENKQLQFCKVLPPISFPSVEISDVTGLKFSGFGRAGPDPSGFRAGLGFLPSGFGFCFGFFKIYKY